MFPLWNTTLFKIVAMQNLSKNRPWQHNWCDKEIYCTFKLQESPVTNAPQNFQKLSHNYHILRGTQNKFLIGRVFHH